MPDATLNLALIPKSTLPDIEIIRKFCKDLLVPDYSPFSLQGENGLIVQPEKNLQFEDNWSVVAGLFPGSRFFVYDTALGAIA